MDATPAHTEDGHFVIVSGRRWRATDPLIPDDLRSELVAELMAARRAVRSDPAAARPRVHDAKIALGERGEPWWVEGTEAGREKRLAAAIRTLLRHRDADKTICPSEAARIVGGSGWRRLMDSARSVAEDLTCGGTVRILQRGHEVDPQTVRGPIRIGRGPNWDI